MRTWIVIDGNNLCHRMFHAQPFLDYREAALGVAFALFREVRALRQRFMTTHLAFCWDSPISKRKQIDPQYKANRRLMSPEEAEGQRLLSVQIDLIRSQYLPELGYRNNFISPGYEGDDVLAAVVQDLPDKVRAVLVSSDKDLYQLLSEKVDLWAPHNRKKAYRKPEPPPNLVTLQWFRETYEIEPVQWADVKAIAGCNSDNVPGVHLVGEVYACRYLRGELKESNIKRLTIERSRERIWKKNLQLVKLPLAGVGKFTVKDDGPLDPTAWEQLVGKLSLKSVSLR